MAKLRGTLDKARQRVIREERRIEMDGTLYTRSGAPIGFHDGKMLYDLRGQAVGQLRGSRVYCMGGHYVGELKNGVILDKNVKRCSIPAYNSAGSGARGGNAGLRNHVWQRLRRNPRQS